MDRALALLAAASVGGVGILAWTAEITDPPIVEIPDLAMHAGGMVRVLARLIDLKLYDGGFAKALLSQGNRSVPMSGPFAEGVSAGDDVQVDARVLQENGRVELELERPAALVVTRPWRDAHIGLDAILADPWTYRDSNVRTSGWIDEDTRGTWLATNDGNGRVILSGRTAALEGDHAVVDGLFEFDPSHAAFRILVEDLSRDDA